MSIVITIADPRLVAAAQKQFAAYLADNPDGTATIEDYLLGTLPLEDWAKRWVPDAKEWLTKWSKEELLAAIADADAIAKAKP